MVKFMLRMLCITSVTFAFSTSIGLTQIGSIFAEDTCAPPCWMGLIPGESTALDAVQLIRDIAYDHESYSSIFEQYGAVDEETQLLSNGIYQFNVFPREASNSYVEIQIRQSVVYSIYIRPTVHSYRLTPQPDEYIILGYTLNQLGQPDLIDYASPLYFWSDFERFTFVYLEPRLRVEFYSPEGGCYSDTIGDDMKIYSITYYSSEAAEELSSYVGSDEPQPALSATGFNQFDVPLEVWQQLFDGDIDGHCEGILSLLPPRDRGISPIKFEEPTVIRSLFADDTCAPPCWFDLTPGESTSEDVHTFIEDSEARFRRVVPNRGSVFDSETGYMLTGIYVTDWLFYEREDMLDHGTYIELREGTLTKIRANMNRVVLLHEVLERLGSPDYITMAFTDLGGSYLTLSYFSLQLQVELQATNTCNMYQMGNAFWVTYVHYYAPMPIEEAQTLNYGGRVVPIDLWHSWINGEVGGGCFWAWEALPESGEND